MNKNRGFTLIELLSVIIVLSIIALIAIPMILNTIEEAKKQAAKVEGLNYIDAVERYVVLSMLDSSKMRLQPNIEYQISSKHYEVADADDIVEVFINDLVEIKGQKPESGFIMIGEDGKVSKSEMVVSNYPLACTSTACNIIGDKINDNDPEESICQIGQEWLFDYSLDEDGNPTEQLFTTPCSGTFKLEVWGAQGASVDDTYIGGYGAYSKGNIYLEKETNLYINIGGQGIDGTSGVITGGYNGGGDTYIINSCSNHFGSGGGATHIALSSGLLNTFENDQNSLLIASAGGGSAAYRYCHSSDYVYGIGGSGGGIVGGAPIITTCWSKKEATGGTQTEGGYGGTVNNEGTIANGSFGKGASYIRTTSSIGQSGGGGGYYGGGLGVYSSSAGGSSYIGNKLLTNKEMYCYNCLESNVLSTKTTSVDAHNLLPEINQAKEGNGYARITYVSSNPEIELHFKDSEVFVPLNETSTNEIIYFGIDSLNSSDISYSSSDTSVFTVDKNGVITGKSVGTAVLTASYHGITIQSPVIVQDVIYVYNNGPDSAINKNKSGLLWGSGSITYNGDNVTLYTNDIYTIGTCVVALVSNNKIDVTDYHYLFVEFESIDIKNNGQVAVGLASVDTATPGAGADLVVHEVIRKSVTNYTVKVDMRMLQDEYFIKIYAANKYNTYDFTNIDWGLMNPALGQVTAIVKKIYYA